MNRYVLTPKTMGPIYYFDEYRKAIEYQQYLRNENQDYVIQEVIENPTIPSPYSKLNLLALAKHILGVANQAYDETGQILVINKLKLHAIIYLLIRKAYQEGVWSKEFIQSFYDVDPMQVWQYGAISPIIEDEYRIYGVESIISNDTIDTRFDDPKITKWIKEFAKRTAIYTISESQRSPCYQKNASKINGWKSDINWPLDAILE